jgi:hypothetical protein
MTTVWADIESGGWKPDTLAVMYGRGTGKSMVNDYVQQWTTIMEKRKPVEITHGQMVQRGKFKCWAKVNNAPWGFEKKVNQWCEETYGPLESTGYKNPRWTNKLSWGVWHFKHDADLTLFLLRWTQ